MFNRSMTQNTHDIIQKHIQHIKKDGLKAVDATVGNGFDLFFLARLGEVKEIVGFDIQECALESSRERIKNCMKPVKLIASSHHLMDQYVKEADIIMFNLGYLPNGDKQLVTFSKTTIEAIQKAIQLLSSEGIITVMTYPGHEEGYREYKDIDAYLSQLYEEGISVFNLSLINTVKMCPKLYVIIKRKICK